MNSAEYDYLMTEVPELTGSSEALLSGVIAGTLATFSLAMMFISLTITILTVIANWKIFVKAGKPGWAALIPIYNLVVLYQVAGVSPWLILLLLFVGVPIVGPLIALGLSIYLMVQLANAFGKGAGFAVGLIFLNTIFIMILGFGDSKYVLKSNNDDNNNNEPQVI